MAERPIFVVGYPRSGTTMFQSSLGRHPRIAAAPELYYWLRVYMVRDELGSLRDDEVLDRVIRRALEVPFGMWDDASVRAEDVLHRMKSLSRTHESVLRAIMDEFASTREKERWSEKSPGQDVAQCLSMIPDAQVLHIIRRVDDVVASNLSMPWQSRTATDLAADWSSFNANALRQGLAAGPESYLQIRYEDLVRAPERVLRIVCTHLDEPFDRSMLEAGASDAVSAISRSWQGRAEEPVRGRTGARSLRRLDRLRVVQASRAVAPALGYGYRRRELAAARLATPLSAPERLRRASRRRWQRWLLATNATTRTDLVERLIDENRQQLDRSAAE